MIERFFFFKQKTAYEFASCLVGSENVYKRQPLYIFTGDEHLNVIQGGALDQNGFSDRVSQFNIGDENKEISLSLSNNQIFLNENSDDDVSKIQCFDTSKSFNISIDSSEQGVYGSSLSEVVHPEGLETEDILTEEEQSYLKDGLYQDQANISLSGYTYQMVGLGEGAEADVDLRLLKLIFSFEPTYDGEVLELIEFATDNIGLILTKEIPFNNSKQTNLSGIGWSSNVFENFDSPFSAYFVWANDDHYYFKDNTSSVTITLGGKLNYVNTGFSAFSGPAVPYGIEVNGLTEVDIFRRTAIKKPLGKDFYVNVKGRINTYDDHPSGFEGSNTPILYNENLIENPIDIIYDILRNELKLTNEQIDTQDFIDARNQHLDWKFGFTINKKINSKKLIEEIAKFTKCFPHFKNDGTFSFNSIKDAYDEDDYANAIIIKEEEIINYSFKKSKPEEIVTEVGVKYKKDYAEDSYLKDIFSYYTEQGWYTKYEEFNNNIDKWEYYGIEDPDESFLEVESDYIRDDFTAHKLREFLFNHHKNNHLIFNIKLPMSYNHLNIGNLVKFDKLFNGLAAYGIDYIHTTIPNGQTYYPLFMITSIKKDLNSVEIECMQLHKLDETVEGDSIEIIEDVEAPVITISGGNITTQITKTFDLPTFTVSDEFDPNPIINSYYTNPHLFVDNGDGTATAQYLGSFNFVVQARDSMYNQASASVTITIEALPDEEQFELAFGEYVLPPYEPENQLYGGVIFKGWLTSGPNGRSLKYAYHSTVPLAIYAINISSGYVIATLEDQLDQGTNVIGDGGNMNPDLFDSVYLDLFISEFSQSLNYDIYDESTHHFGIFVGPVGVQIGTTYSPPNTQVNGTSGNSVSQIGYIQWPQMIDVDNPSFEIYDIIPYDYSPDNVYSGDNDTTSDTTSIAGDVNFDDVLNVLDVVLMVNLILGRLPYTQEQVTAGDLNYDLGMDILDVVIVVNIILES